MSQHTIVSHHLSACKFSPFLLHTIQLSSVDQMLFCLEVCITVQIPWACVKIRHHWLYTVDRDPLPKSSRQNESKPSILMSCKVKELASWKNSWWKVGLFEGELRNDCFQLPLISLLLYMRKFLRYEIFAEQKANRIFLDHRFFVEK